MLAVSRRMIEKIGCKMDFGALCDEVVYAMDSLHMRELDAFGQECNL